MTEPLSRENTFSRELRLLTPDSFSYVFSNAVPVSTSSFTLLGRKNNLTHPRIGLTIAKKRVKAAVNRNAIKRVVREQFRLNQQNLPNIDIIFIAKKDCNYRDKRLLARELCKAFERLTKRCKH